jgi:hypothetical protein
MTIIRKKAKTTSVAVVRRPEGQDPRRQTLRPLGQPLPPRSPHPPLNAKKCFIL